MKLVMLIVCCLGAVAGICRAEERKELTGEQEKVNYSVGYQIGGDFKRQGVELVPDALVQGIRDALAGTKPQLAPEAMRSALIDLKRKIVAADEEQRKKDRANLREEGRKFHAENSGKDGVVSLPSGLQYKVIVAGSGRHPTLRDSITVNYRGTLIDGTEFDSTHRDGKPATIPLESVIPGWKEALPLMGEGAKWQIFVPSKLAFGERGPLEERTLIYEIELIAVKSGTQKP